MKALLLALLALNFSAHLGAEDIVPESGLCREERKALNGLRQELDGFRQRAAQIEALLDGNAAPDVTTADLKLLLSSDDGETLPTEWPAGLRCESLQEAYGNAREALVWQKAHLARLRRTYWHALPTPVHEAMLEIWQSRARITHSAQSLDDSGVSEPDGALPAAVTELDERLQSVRLAFLGQVSRLRPEMSSRDVEQWLGEWRRAMELATSPLIPAAESLESTGAPAPLLGRHFQLAQTDALVIADAFNTVRGWLWENQRDAFLEANSKHSGNSLLLDELHALVVALLGLVADIGIMTHGNEARGPLGRVFLGLEYFIGLLGLVVLGILARATRKPAAAAQAAFARRYRGTRAKAQLVRLTTSLPVLSPWIVGWFGLVILENLFHKYHFTLLLPVVPFARLYIVYGLLSLTGEWFLHRIAGLAGTYLSPAQHAKMAGRARGFARIVILPWFLMDLVNLALGPSLTLSLLSWVTLGAIVIALGLLLRPWRPEFIKALQSILPASWDGWIERVFSGWRFVLLAPLVTPLMLLAMTLFFMHKGLVDFDWYRKLMARSFKLRSGQAEEEEASQSEEHALADYQRWFGETPGEGEEYPFISVDVLQRLQNCLSAWLHEKSEENSLLFSGERGSGKTTLLQKAQEWLKQQEEQVDIHYLEVPAKCIEPSDIAELLEPALGVSLSEGPAELVKGDATRTPTILILDNAQNFFLRKVGGLEGWEFLLSLARARLSNLYWIVAINNQSWAYLGNVFGRDYQFNTLLYTRRWSQSEIRALILSRNQLSGYRIHYDSILLSSRGPEAGNIRNAEQLYFSLLWDACSGNPLLALRLWLSSVTVTGGQVTVGLPAEVSGATLERLSKEMHFVYAALALHENMTSEELVAATALPESRVRAALKTAFDIGFVQRSANRRYRFVPLWYPAVTRLLARKNLLHE